MAAKKSENVPLRRGRPHCGPFMKIDLSYTRLNGHFMKMDLSYTRLNGPFMKIDLSYIRLNEPLAYKKRVKGFCYPAKAMRRCAGAVRVIWVKVKCSFTRKHNMHKINV